MIGKSWQLRDKYNEGNKKLPKRVYGVHLLICVVFFNAGGTIIKLKRNILNQKFGRNILFAQ